LTAEVFIGEDCAKDSAAKSARLAAVATPCRKASGFALVAASRREPTDSASANIAGGANQAKLSETAVAADTACAGNDETNLGCSFAEVVKQRQRAEAAEVLIKTLRQQVEASEAKAAVQRGRADAAEAEAAMQRQRALSAEKTAATQHLRASIAEAAGETIHAERMSREEALGKLKREAGETIHAERMSHEEALGKLKREVAHLQARHVHDLRLLQDLQGHVRVACRIRPAEGAGSEESAAVRPYSETPALTLLRGGQPCDFRLDAVYGPEASHDGLCSEMERFAISTLDGYKACVFTYGQTGSGKTHTMKGIAPRCFDKVFRACEEMRVRGWSWSLKVSAVEIYVEQINDLLQPSGGSHDMRQSSDGVSEIGGVVYEVSSAEQCLDLWLQAMRHRVTASTKSNDRSSRSHLVFMLQAQSDHGPILDHHVKGALYLVDLAGSERFDRSGMSGDRLAEMKAINASLTTLGRVFLQRASNGHLPVRDSKLTEALEPCFSSTGKLMMIVNVRAEARNADETFHTLTFAKSIKDGQDGQGTTRSAQGQTRLSRGASANPRQGPPRPPRVP
jgi:kinesin family protein C1